MLKIFKSRIKFQLIVILSALFVVAGITMYKYSVNKSLQEEERSLKTDFLLKEKFSSFENPGKMPAVLLIHGFGGSPYDLKPLTEKLAENNIALYSILLSGHGTSPKDLLKVNDGDWFKEVLIVYDYLNKKYGKVRVVGFSIGGALAIKLATKRSVKRIALISPYFKVKRHWYYLNSLGWWAKRMGNVISFIRKLKIGQINNHSGLSQYIAYKHLPLKSIEALKKIGEESFSIASKVKCPILVLHSQGDNVADFEKSYQAFQKIDSLNKEFVKYKKSNHIILYDYDAQDALNRLMEFLLKED